MSLRRYEPDLPNQRRDVCGERGDSARGHSMAHGVLERAGMRLSCLPASLPSIPIPLPPGPAPLLPAPGTSPHLCPSFHSLPPPSAPARLPFQP